MASAERTARILAAIRAVEARGEKPSARRVWDEAGLPYSPMLGLNGRDATLFGEVMTTQAGYRRVAVGHTFRYVKEA